MNIAGSVVAIVVGAVVGGLAERVLPHGGYGRRADTLLGVAGSAATIVSIWVAGIAPDGGVTVPMVLATVGAGLVLLGQRRIALAPLGTLRRVGSTRRP